MTAEQLGLYCFFFLLGLGALGILVAIIKTMLKGIVITFVLAVVIGCGWVVVKGAQTIGLISSDSALIMDSKELEQSLKNEFNE